MINKKKPNELFISWTIYADGLDHLDYEELSTYDLNGHIIDSKIWKCPVELEAYKEYDKIHKDETRFIISKKPIIFHQCPYVIVKPKACPHCGDWLKTICLNGKWIRTCKNCSKFYELVITS